MDLKSEDTEEYESIKNEIMRLENDLSATRERMFKLFEQKRQTELIQERLYNSSELESPLSTLKLNPNLTLWFHDKYLDIQMKQHDSLITLLFPFNGENRFGCNIRKSREWNLEKYQLPPSIDVEYFQNEIKNASLGTVSQYLEEIQNNVYAFYIREEQVEKLKEIMDSNISLYHCFRYVELELTFKFFDTETNTRRLVTIQLNFKLLSILPDEVICEVKKAEDEEMETFLRKHFKVFTQTDLISAYKLAFTNVNRYKFFV